MSMVTDPESGLVECDDVSGLPGKPCPSCGVTLPRRPDSTGDAYVSVWLADAAYRAKVAAKGQR